MREDGVFFEYTLSNGKVCQVYLLFGGRARLGVVADPYTYSDVW